jgi:hypothetical protein
LKWFAGFLFLCLTSQLVLGQGAVKLPEEEQKQKEKKLAKEQEFSRRILKSGQHRLRRQDVALAAQRTAHLHPQTV